MLLFHSCISHVLSQTLKSVRTPQPRVPRAQVRGDSMKKSKISGNFRTKNFEPVFFQFFFPISKQAFQAALHGVLGDYYQCKIINFSTKKWSVWTKNFRVVLKNGPPRAAGRKLCKMGAGRPEVILSAVKCLASSGAFEKFTKF